VVEALGRPWVAPKPVPVAAAAAPRSAAPLSNAAFLRPPVRVSLPVELAVVTAPQLVATPVAAPRADTTPAAERAHADANLPHSAVPGLGVLFRHKGDGASTAWFAQHQPAARGDAPNNANPARDSGSFSQTSQNGDTSRAAENTTTRDHAYSRHGDSRGPGYASGQGGAGSD
ncbi:MAG: hypothetical protein ACRDF8_09640, partial [Chloroflexota bacterium]